MNHIDEIIKLANQFFIKTAANKIKVPSWVANPDIWIKANKKIKKYWDKYEKPYGAVVNLYHQMGGKKNK